MYPSPYPGGIHRSMRGVITFPPCLTNSPPCMRWTWSRTAPTKNTIVLKQYDIRLFAVEPCDGRKFMADWSGYRCHIMIRTCSERQGHINRNSQFRPLNIITLSEIFIIADEHHFPFSACWQDVPLVRPLGYRTATYNNKCFSVFASTRRA